MKNTIADTLMDLICKRDLTERGALAIVDAFAESVRYDVPADEFEEFPAGAEPPRFVAVGRFADCSELAFWRDCDGGPLCNEAFDAAQGFAHEAWQWDGLGFDGLPA